MKTIIQIAVFLIYSKIIFSQTQQPKWVNVSPFPDDYIGTIHGFFLSEKEGWIWQGSKYKSHTLYYTNDGANTFEPIHTLNDSANGFRWMQMLDRKNGYCITCYTDCCEFLRTRDCGITWQQVNIDTAFLNQFNNPLYYLFYFTDTLTGYTSQYIPGEGMAIFRSTDGAKTWQETSITGLEEAGLILRELGGATRILFYDALHGWALVSYAIGAGICLKTTDGGLTWQPAHNYGTDLFGIDFISPRKGGIVGRNASSSNVYLTENNFETLSFEYQSWGSEMQQLAYTISYQNDSIIWISGTPGTFYRSTDNGLTFEVYESYLENDIDVIFNIWFFNGNVGYAFGAFNKLMKYSDTLTSVSKFQPSSKFIKLYPNPASDKIVIKLPDKSEGNLIIYNAKGNSIYEKLLNGSNNVINISQFNNGIYFVTFINEGGFVFQQKFIKYN